MPQRPSDIERLPTMQVMPAGMEYSVGFLPRANGTLAISTIPATRDRAIAATRAEEHNELGKLGTYVVIERVVGEWGISGE